MAEKIAYFDMFSGISGDMTLGAFVDLGVPVEWLNEQFELMPLPEADIRAENIWHNGIKGVNLFVEEREDSGCHPEHKHDHSGSGCHSHHDHLGTHNDHDETHHHHLEEHLTDPESAHSHSDAGSAHCHSDADHPEDDHAVNHHHPENGRPAAFHGHSRNYAQIRELISNSPFSQYVKSSSLRAFEKIAMAESEIHGTSIEKVHFHEVGGMDAVVDIVGAFLSVEYLGITKIYGSVPSVGKGAVRCSHGMIPLPAPATLKILKGVPVNGSGCDMELITPTGAAIITTLTDQFGDIPNMVIGDTGYGAGKNRSIAGLPNILRIITGEEPLSSEEGRYEADKDSSTGSFKENINIFKEEIYILETSIDDMNPEIAGYIMETLFERGALDVSYTPLQMKKNRPAFKLEVLCRRELLDTLIELILTESTSSGVRFYKVERAALARKSLKIDTAFGKIEVKQITDPRGEVRTVPEYEVCRKIAREEKIPLRDLYFLIDRAGLNYTI